MSTTIGQRLRTAREAAGLSQERLAAKAELTTNTIHRIETGCAQPKIETVRKLARALGVSPGTPFA